MSSPFLLADVDIQIALSISNDAEQHLFGASVFTATYSSASGSLWKAAFWLCLRQDIYMAVLCQRPIKLDMSSIWIDSSFLPAEDCEWSHLISLIVADIVCFCFSSSADRTCDRWRALEEKILEWHLRRPSSYEPYFYRDRAVSESRYFPDHWHSTQWHGNHIIPKKESR